MDWKNRVYPHGQWEMLAEGVWQISGHLAHGPMSRNMVVARLASGGLFLHSVICLNEEAMKQMENFGKPEIMVVPNPLHRLDAAAYLERYPDLKVICPQSIVDKVQMKVKVSDTVESLAPVAGFMFHRIQGVKSSERAYEFGPEGNRVLVVCDVLMNMPNYSGVMGKIMRWMGSTGFFGMTRIGRWGLLKNREAFVNWLVEMSNREDLKILSMAHGEAIREQFSNRLKEAARRLKDD